MLKYFFSPSGRIGRADWWLGQLIIGIVLGLYFLQLLWALQDKAISGAEILMIGGSSVVCLFLIWFNFCLIAKRYHDRNKSAWWFLFQFVPLVGPIWMLIELGFLGGEMSENDFGPGPAINIDEDIRTMMGMNQTSLAVEPMITARPMPTYPTNGGKPAFGRRT